MFIWAERGCAGVSRVIQSHGGVATATQAADIYRASRYALCFVSIKDVTVQATSTRSWKDLSQAERDAAYDNNAAARNSAKQIADRNAASARVRAANASALDIPYASRERTKFDLYPAAAYGAPCFVFIHGGYWQRNGREVFAMLVEGLAAHGWSVAIPGYTLAPDASLTQIAEEIGLALDWLAKRGAEFGIAGPVLLSGWSAGAQLAALHLSHPSVIAALAISGVYDLAPIRDTGLNAALSLSEDEIRSLSPLQRPSVPKPMAIAYGTEELPSLVQDARSLHARRQNDGASGPLVPIEGADHFSILNDISRSEGRLLPVAHALIKAHLR